MWHSDIFIKITFSSEVLVLSDITPFRNVMFYDVLTPPGSSFCNGARFSFQAAFALRDIIKCRSYGFSFCQLNNPCTRRSINFNVSKLKSKNLSFQLQNSMTNVSVTLCPPYLCPLQSSIIFGWNTSLDNAQMKNCWNLVLGKAV